jgi:FkbM family methyltransferase
MKRSKNNKNVVVSLPNKCKCEIEKDYLGGFQTIHELFYKNVYDILSIHNDDSVLDCGANIGLFTLKVVPQCFSVVSVEPASFNFYLLQRNIELNALGRKVTPIRRVISCKSGIPLTLHLRKSGVWNTIYPPDDGINDNVECIESISVDDLSETLGEIRRFKN